MSPFPTITTNLPTVLESYRDLIYVPLDIQPPTIDKSKIIQWFAETFNKDSKFGKSNTYSGITNYVIHPDDYPWDNIRLVDTSYKLKLAGFPTIVEYIDNLPFEYVTGVSIIQQHPGVDVPIHSDNDGWCRITSYLINDSNARIFFQKAIKPTLPFKRLSRLETTIRTPDGRLKISQSWQNVVSAEKNYGRYTIPNCSFHINNSHAVHGVEAVPTQPNLRITLTVNGKLDYDRYAELLANSLTKYPDYAIWY
jgi:hypothetical protein